MSQENRIVDKEFEIYLQGKSELSQQYADIPEVKLPDHLDAAILAEAHRAVGSRPGSIRKHSWTMPLSLVATLFVVVMAGLILPDMLKDMRRQQEYAPQPAGSALQEIFNTAQEGAGAPYPANSPAPAASPERRLPEPEVIKAERSASVTSQKRMADTLASAGAIGAMKPQPKALLQNQMQPVAAGQALPAMPQKQLMISRSDKEVATDQETLRAAAAPVAGIEAAMSAREEAAPMAALAKRKMAEPPVEAKKSEQLARPAPASIALEPLPAAVVAAPEMPVGAAHDIGKADKLQADEEVLQPAAWIARIRKLKLQGRKPEAEKELVAFRKHYPDFRLPDDLAATPASP